MGKFSAYKMFNNANCLIIFHLPSRALFLLLSSYDNFREIPFAWLQILLYYSVIEFLNRICWLIFYKSNLNIKLRLLHYCFCSKSSFTGTRTVDDPQTCYLTKENANVKFIQGVYNGQYVFQHWKVFRTRFLRFSLPQ